MKRIACLFTALVAVVLTSSFSACAREPVAPPDGDPGRLASDGWAELPVMEPADGVKVVTHWVSAAGEAGAGADDPGRVRNYTIAFDTSSRQPLWAAYPMHPWYDGDAGRGNSWRPDPYIPEGEQPDLRTSYNPVGDNGSFSRGHLLASDCRQRSRAMNDQTFLFTNSAPQTQNAFNGGIWLRLEELEKRWGFDGAADVSDTLYVVTGSTFIGDDGVGPRVTSDDDGNEIPVPTHFYKALLTTRGTGIGKPVGTCSAAELRCVVFYLEHFGHANNARPTSHHMMSVDDLERVTGIDFFPMIAPEAESVESNYDLIDWGMQ